MALVSLDDEVCILKVFYILHIPRPTQCREWLGLALQLHFECLDMILIYMRIAELDDELTRFGTGHFGDHVRKESVRRDVERDTEPQVCRPLIHEAREARFSVGLGIRGQVDVKLAKEMTRR